MKRWCNKLLEELNQTNDQECQCGFPLQLEDDICVVCLPPQFRMTLGRQMNWYHLLEINEDEHT